MRPIGEGLIKRKVFAGAHTVSINSNLEKLTGSLSQDFRWRDHVNRAFLSRPHASAVQEALG